MIRSFLLSIILLCGLCSQVRAQDQIGDKETLSVVGWAYFCKDLMNKIELSEASSGIPVGDSLIFMDGNSPYTFRFDPANKNRVLVSDRKSVNAVGILKWENSRLVSVRFPDRYAPRDYTIKQNEPHHYALHHTYNNEPQPPVELWMDNGAISMIRVWGKSTRLLSSGYARQSDIVFTTENQSCRVVVTRYKNGDIKNGVIDEMLYTVTPSLYRREGITGQYIDEDYLRPDGQITRSVSDGVGTRSESEYEYDDLGRRIHYKNKMHRKKLGDIIETEGSIEFIGDKEFRRVEKNVSNNPRYDSKIRIDVMFDKPDADPATMPEWEYKQGQYLFTPDNDLYKVIQPVPGEEGKFRVRTKTDGVWSDWLPLTYVY
jgi:hypothetical protein